MLRKLKHKLPQEQLIMVYRSIIQPHFDYCISVWGQTSKANVLLLQRLQNRAARIIMGLYDWNISASKLVKDLGWMNIAQRINYFTSLLTYKSLNNLTPSYMSENIRPQQSTYKTRNSDVYNLVVPKPNLEIFKRSFNYSAPLAWNNLPPHVQQSTSILMFKERYKVFL